MAGGGSIQGMATILRNNKKLLRKRNPFRRGTGFERLREAYQKYSSGRIESKPISENELLKIRKKIINQNKKDNIQSGILLLVVLLITIGSTLSIYKGIRDYQNEVDAKILKTNTKKYLFYIEDGDGWLNKEHFNNALFQYYLAKEIFPNEYDVNYRIALVYGSKCKYENSSCSKGLRVLKELEVQFPERDELNKLRAYFN